MSYKITNPYIKYPLLALYALVQGYFIGLMFVWTLPGIPSISWAYGVVLDYILGVTLSGILAFAIFKKWQLALNKKIMIAAALLLIIALISINVSTWMLQEAKMRAAEALGLL